MEFSRVLVRSPGEEVGLRPRVQFDLAPGPADLGDEQFAGVDRRQCVEIGEARHAGARWMLLEPGDPRRCRQIGGHPLLCPLFELRLARPPRKRGEAPGAPPGVARTHGRAASGASGWCDGCSTGWSVAKK